MEAIHKYSLQKYAGPRSRHTCPSCGKARVFTLYIVNETGQPIAPHVGKCDRANNCGYHYAPVQYFADTPQAGDGDAWKQSEAWKTEYQQPQAPRPVTYLPRETMEATLKDYDRNNFVRYLVGLFGQQKALELAQAYHLGTSKHWRNDGGLSVVFWQVDAAGNVRQAKIMAYNPETGRRLKAKDEAERRGKDGRYYPDTGQENKVVFKGKRLAGDDANLVQCFFGEHLLAQHPEKPVCLVESEKTAVIMAAFMPAAVWLAAGGKNGAKWTERTVFKALAGRQVILYPDLGAYREWKEKGKILATVCEVAVSDLLERKAQGEDWQAGYDIADYFTKAPQDETEQPKAQAEAVHAKENALTAQQEQPSPRKEPLRLKETPLKAQQNAEGDEAPAPEQTPVRTPENGPDGDGLPEGFAIVEVNGGNVLEVDGIPFTWLTEEEQEGARRRMTPRQTLAVMAAFNPLVNAFTERFNLVADEATAV